jgi:hypothetical protein
VSDISSHVDLILGSPVGRQVLAAYVGFGPGGDFERELFKRLGLGAVPGTSALTAPGAGTRSWQEVSPALASTVTGIAVSWRSWREKLADLTEAELVAAVGGETFDCGFRGGDEAMWGLTAMAVDQLRPVAEALVSSSAARRWWQPADLAVQRFVEWDGQPRLSGPALEQAVSRCMAEERAANTEGLRWPRPMERPGEIIGAYWWSAPDFAPQSWTTPAIGGLPAVALYEFFDTWRPPPEADGATVWSTPIDPAARVLEITGPADWRDLVARFPREVTGTHDGEWRSWGNAPGPWLLPDWEQAMQHYDGVHVTTGAAVASYGLALPVGDAYTMLAAWVPDATLWLRDKTAEPRRIGRWNDGPQRGEWDTPPEEWGPDED